MRYVVVRSVPFQTMTEVELKPVPVIVSGKPALPAIVFPGLNDVIFGADEVTVNVREFEVTPASATVMLNVPAVAKSDAGMLAVS